MRSFYVQKHNRQVMSDINNKDKQLLDTVKNEISIRLGKKSQEEWSQKDFEYVIYLIENDSGTQISLSTLKRIWKNEYSRLPHIATLNALSQLAFSKDWMTLKHGITQNKDTSLKSRIRKPKKSKVWFAFVSLLVVVSVILFLPSSKEKDKVQYDPESISFSCKTSGENIVPNSVVFQYDVESVHADSFYIQQSWDATRRIRIDQTGNTQTDIYYTPGYYNAKLIANDSIIKQIPVHIVYNDWYVAIYQDVTDVVPFTKKEWNQDSSLTIETTLLEKRGVDLNDRFFLNFYNVREFGVGGDDLTYTAQFQLKELSTVLCPRMSLLIKGDNSLFWISFVKKGCESNLSLICSDQYYDGKKEDLTQFGVHADVWNKLKIETKQNKLSISLNDSLIFTDTYTKKIGSIKAIDHLFEGIGAIDEVKLLDKDDNIVFSDSF